jgi:hypothetical protein
MLKISTMMSVILFSNNKEIAFDEVEALVMAIPQYLPG